MTKPDKRSWWKAAGLGGLVGGVFGPLIGSMIIFSADLVHDLAAPIQKAARPVASA